MKSVVKLGGLLTIILILATGALAEMRQAAGRIELEDPVGEVVPIKTSRGQYPGLDVARMLIASDGHEIKIQATLKDPPGDLASAILVIYFDVDLDPETGARLMFIPEQRGFEYKAQPYACVKFDNGLDACTGGPPEARPVERYGAIGLDRFTGSDENDKQIVVSSLGSPDKKASRKTPIQGKVVTTFLDYQDLGARPGQTIRILARKACSLAQPESLFPEILLTLN